MRASCTAPTSPTRCRLYPSWAPASAAALAEAASGGRVPSDLVSLANDASGRLEPGPQGGAVYTDDRAPVEWLVDGSIQKVAARGQR